MVQRAILEVEYNAENVLVGLSLGKHCYTDNEGIFRPLDLAMS